MTAPSGPRAVIIRRTGLAITAAAGVVAIVVGRQDFLLVWLALILFTFYLTFCAEPLRRVVRTTTVSRALATTYLLTALLCVVSIFSLPISSNDRLNASVSLFSLSAGQGDISSNAAGVWFSVAMLAFGLLILGTLALWYQVMLLARRTRWASIDHASGDGALLTGATLQEPLGSSVTRPAESRPVQLRKNDRT